MILLLLFALLAGAGTALSPCVLPLLPVILSAGATGGRRRPLGVVVGLTLSFAFATVALASVIDALGLPDDLLRWIAIGTLIAFGTVLMVPALADRLEAWLSRLVPGPARVQGDGFVGGLFLGASLGIVYVPCAGPILAGVIAGAASQDFTAGRVAVALAYALGSAIVLYGIMIGGRKLVDRAKRRRAQVQIAMGVAMVLIGVAMSFDLDTRFQSAIADDLPAFLVNPTEGLEKSAAVTDALAGIRGGGGAAREGGEAAAEKGAKLPDYGPAPEITNPGEWFNTGGKPVSIADLTADGRVVLVDFWTYTCINCIRTLPYVKAWDAKYRDRGLTVIGVHTPEFPFEREASNVRTAINDDGISYPVVQDNDYGTWDAFQNQYWPAKYLIGSDGEVRYTHFGEGGYATTEKAIRSLLAEAGDRRLGGKAKAQGEKPDPSLQTPETYLGGSRAQGFYEALRPGTHAYHPPSPGELQPSEFAYGGKWDITAERAVAAQGASLSLRFQARRVFLVLGSTDRPRTLGVELDGKPIPDSSAGDDVHSAKARISNQRLYRLVDLPKGGDHTLRLSFEPGIAGYAFTFG